MDYFQKLRKHGKDRIQQGSARIQQKLQQSSLLKKQDALKKYIAGMKDQAGKKLKTKAFPHLKKQEAVLGFGLVALLVLGVTLSSEGVPVLEPTYEGYTVMMDDQEIGIVEEQENVRQMIEDIEKDLQDQYQENIVVEDEHISFVEGEFKEKESPLTDLSVIEKRILRSIDYNVQAYAIEIEGQALVNVRSEKEALEILETIKEDFIDEETEYDTIEFHEEVEIQETLVSLSEVEETETALRVLQNGTDEEKVHAVKEGETISEIAKQYGLTSEEIEKANSHLEDLHMISIGDELNLVVPRPYITVRTVEYVEYTEEIDFETEYNDTDSLYEGDRKITQQGAIGEREISGYIIRENGRKVDLEIEEEKILSEPVTRIVARGTAERPTTVATGAFSSPTRGRLTSRFGPRWGTMHNGIDVAGPTGTPIKSADAGRVEFAGYRGSYGNLVIINHENGYQTYYAHLNGINVSRGQRVFKGAKIGSMGNTGRSTGPHLHFEVRKNGHPTNPLNFVSY